MSSVSQLLFRGASVCTVLVAALFVVYSVPSKSPEPAVAAAQEGTEVPTLALSTSEIDFGQVRPGVAESAIITLTHTGSKASGTLVIDNLFLDELDSQRYSVNTGGPIKLSPSQSFDLVVGFEPNEFGALPGRLILNHSGVAGVEVIDLNGEGFDVNEPVMRAANPASYPFGKSTLAGFGNGKPTSLQFGPDGRLYVAFMDGLIKVFTVERNGSNDYDVTDTDTITLVKNILNHNDDGSKKASLKSRLVTGLLVVGTASAPIIYVHSSDPRIGGGHSGNTTGLDTNSGVLSRLTLTSNGWKKLDLVRGLPRSEENHHSNGLAIVGSKLYLAAGGNTNMGAMSNNFAMLPEYALSAAILEIDLAEIGDTTYDLPTLNDEDRGGKKDSNDPFGGNRGKNQAMLVQGGPVQVYAPGFRNPYDVIVMQNGKMYSWDNGPNSGWGGAPNNCSNGRQEPGNTQHDALHLITEKGYYGGHPNPTRGSTKNKFNNSNPQSPVPNANGIECNYYGPGTNGNGKHNKNKSLVSLARSTNGLAEYTANNFFGDINGDLLATSWDNKVYRVSFKASGALDDINVLFSNVGSSPLDVTAQSDNGIFPGTIWVADLQGKDIVIYEPDDYEGGGDGGGGDACVVTNGNGDADGDGFTNDDEAANGTDGCSAADVPADADADQISDLLDPDDDNDNIPDLDDPFALDTANGAGTNLGVDYQWENDSPDPGFIARLGFSGLMTNGTDDYQTLFDLNEMTIIGAAGVLTIDSVPAGDPLRSKNSQQYGFQFGVNVSAISPVFRAHTRILAPFSGFVPKNHQSMGIYIGTGDQDNYLKLVIKNDTAQMFSEVDGQAYLQQTVTESFVGADYVDLFIEVDPASAIATAYYQITTNGQTATEAQVSSFDFPATWLAGSTKLAVGIISTSVGAQPFPATWDFITVKPLNSIAANAAPDVTIYAPGSVTVGVPVSLGASVSDDGLPDNTLSSTWSKLSGPGTVTFSDETSALSNATFSAAGTYILELSANDGDQTSTATAELLVTDGTPATNNIIYRINTGGPSLSDASGDWQSDASAEAFVNTGRIWKSSAPVDISGLAIAVPAQLFHTERFDKAGAPDLEWKLPVTPGQYQVNLYFSENYIGAMVPGGRVFDIDVEGQLISGLDIYASVGGNKALMKSVTVQSDAVLNISFSRITQNPAIKGIEVIQTGAVVPSVTPVTNQAPIVNAGSDRSAAPGAAVVLTGQVTDDDLPDGVQVNNWTMFSGPDNVLFSSANNATTSVVLPTAGIYVLRLTANDGALQGSDDIKITVADEPTATNTTPVVYAGADAATTVAIPVSLAGNVVDDGLPAATTTVRWSKQSGPAAVVFGNDTLANTTARFSAAGSYVLRLSASDTVLGSFDEISISVTASQTALSEATLVASDGYQSVNGVVSIEIENYTSKSAGKDHQWVNAQNSNASSDGSMVTSPDKGAINRSPVDAAVINYRVNFNQAGTYTVWLRGWGDTENNEGKSDSVYVGLNSVTGKAKVMQNFPTGWHWSKQQRGGGAVTLNIPSAGEHEINLWMREDGLILDKLVLFKSSSTIPGGKGPEATISSYSENTGLPVVDDPDNTGIEVVNSEPVVDETVASESDTSTELASRTPADDSTVNAADSGGYQSVNGVVSIEIENYTSKSSGRDHQWINAQNSNASSDGSMVTSPDKGIINRSPADAAVLNYRVNFNQSGTYTVWLRGWGDSVRNEGRSDSVYVGLNNIMGKAQVMQNFPTGWHWSKQQRNGGVVTLSIPSVGEHEINLWMREDGLILDKLLLTKSTSMVPAGTGEAETLGGNSSISVPDISDSVAQIPVESNNTAQSTVSKTADWKHVKTIDESTVVRRHEAGGVVFNGNLYVLGGRGNRKVSVYNPDTRKWAQKSAPPLELNHFQPVVYGNKIWVIGAFTGKYPNETAISDIYTYTPATDKWAKGGSIPQQRTRGSAGVVTYEGLIYIIGGNNNGHKPGAKPWFDSFNPQTGKWTVLADAPNSRDHVTVSVSGGKMVVAAGRKSAYPDTFSDTVSSTNVYDFSKSKWSQGKAIPTTRAGTMAVTVGSEVIVIGGESADIRNARNVVEAYNVNTNTWRSLRPLQVGRHGGAAAVVGENIHVVSGSERRGGAPESIVHEILEISH